MTVIEAANDLDAADLLAHMLDRFVPATPGAIFLNGGSLGRLPAATPDLMADVVRSQWGERLAEARTLWFDIAQRMGDRVAAVALGARPGEVVVSDCTSVNLYKLALAALEARPGRTTIVTDDDNFPTDRYVLAGLAPELRVVHTDIDNGLDLDVLGAALDDTVALVSLSLVSYRSGALLDMAAVNEVVHAAGALILWDLSHAVGAVPIELTASGADMAVGSTYKHLFGGPGSPSLLYVRRELQRATTQPIHGWYGHRDQLAFVPEYDPDPSIRRFLTGGPPVLSVAAIGPGLDVIAEAGLPALRAKSMALTSLMLELMPPAFRLASPPDPERRGAHITFEHPQAMEVHARLREAQVYADLSLPNRLRFSPAPVSTRFADIAEAVARIRAVSA